MKKLLPLLLILFVNAASAQYRDDIETRKFFLSAGAELGIPTNTPFSISYGALAKAEYKVSNPVGITITGGIDSYFYKNGFLNFSGQTAGQHPTFAPVKLGVRYYSGPGLYIEGEAGSALTVSGTEDTNSLFVYSLGIGFNIPLNKLSDIDLGFRYDGFSERQYATTALHVGYRIGW